MIKYLMFFLVLVFVCVPEVGAVSKGSPRNPQNCDLLPIQMFASDRAPQPYIILGKIHSEAGTPKSVSCKIKRLAYKYGGNAVLNYNLVDQPMISGWSGSTQHSVNGIVVRWANDTEKGMTMIPKDYPIPVLE